MDAGLSRRLRGLLFTREPTGGLKEGTAAGNGPARRMLSITLGAGARSNRVRCRFVLARRNQALLI